MNNLLKFPLLIYKYLFVNVFINLYAKEVSPLSIKMLIN